MTSKLILYPDIGKSTLISRERYINNVIICFDLRNTLKENTAVFSNYRNGLSVTFDRDMTIKTFFIDLLPVVTAVRSSIRRSFALA